MENKNDIQVQVNVINQLKLFKQSTFTDPLCFLDEDIQNAQRAGANIVKITADTYTNTLTVENNGAVLDNMQALFSIAESNWDDEVMETENPFGIGFFSNVSVCDYIEVISGNKYVKFDVNEMIKTRDCKLKPEDAVEFYDGFKLILNGFDFDTIYDHKIKKRAERLGKYVHELDIYYDGELQEKKDLFEPDGDYPFYTEIDDEIKGWIALGDDWSFNSELNIFYKGRFVTKLDNFPYIKGDIHISDKLVNLKAPDRNAIIKDQKYENFIELIQLYIQDLAEDSFINTQIDNMENYCSAINYYADKDKLMKIAKFAVFSKEDVDYLTAIAIAKSKTTEKIESFKDYKAFLDEKEANQNESFVEEIIVEEPIEYQVPVARGTTYESGGSYSGTTHTPEIKEEDTEEKEGEIIFNSSETLFWINFNEIITFEYEFNVIKHYGLKLIVARNKIEKEMLKELQKVKKAFHISELNEEISFKSTISNTKLNMKEKRTSMILNMISRMFDSSHNMFAIGDVMTTKTVSIDKAEIIETIVDENVVIIKDSASDKIYVDRSVIDMSKISENLDETITLQDVQFILGNIDEIVESIYLLRPKMKNKDNKCMNSRDIQNKLINILAEMN